MVNSNDQLVLEPHDISHMTWETTHDTSQKTSENYGDSVGGVHNGKRLPKKNKICKGQSIHASNACLKDVSGESEGFDQAKEISDAIFQFKTSLTRAVHITNMTETLPTGEGMLDYKLVGGARMPMDGLIYDDENASEMSSSCHFPLINSQAIETNGLFEGEHVVGREYDFLEHPWDNINNLSNLEDVDSIFQDPLFPSATADVDVGSPVQNSFPGMQCKSTSITLKSEVSLKNDYSCFQSELESIGKGNSLSVEGHIGETCQVSPSQAYGAGETYRTLADNSVDEETIEAIVLDQLKVVMMQLSLRARIYIRDALYRLARNARQRHAVTEGGSTRSVCGDSSNSRIRLKQEFLSFSRYNGINLVETETNPIDRCIAELLFCTQSSHSSINASDKHLLSSSFDVETKTTSSPGTSGLTQQRDGQGATMASQYFALTTALDSVDPFHGRSKLINVEMPTGDARTKLINVEMPTGDARTNPTTCEDENKVKAARDASATRTSGKGLQCSDIYQKSDSKLSYPRQSHCFHSCLGLPYFGLRQETPHLFRLSVDLDHTFKGDKTRDFYALKGDSRGETAAQNSSDRDHSPEVKLTQFDTSTITFEHSM